MVQELSPDTQAVLLLYGRFNSASADAVEPLKQSEYERLARWLRERAQRPADLLQAQEEDALEEVAQIDLEPARLQRLLQRGTAVALAVEKWLRSGLWVISRSDEAYPKRLKKRLGHGAPPLLYGAGDPSLLEGGGLAIVGSRHATEPALEFTRALAERCAREGMGVISGGARGVDAVAMQSASEAGGCVIGVLADRLLRASLNAQNRAGLLAGRLVLVSSYHPESGFHAGNAMARNQYIYTLADYALVVQADLNKGGTWAGAAENLHRGWVPLFVNATADLPGNQALLAQGGQPFAFNPDAGLSLHDYLADAAARPATCRATAPAAEGHTPGSESPPAPAAQAAESVRAYAQRASAGMIGNQPAGMDMFGEFCRRIESLLRDCPRTLKEIQEALGLESGQTKSWLAKAEKQRVVVKLNRPTRFDLPRERSLL